MDIHHITGALPHLVRVKDIDVSPGPYCMSFGFDLGPLSASIQEVGLINAPMTVKNKEGKRDIVAGYRRILALKSLHTEKIPCRDLSDSGLTPLQLLILNFRDNLATRKFNDVEKAMILARLASHITCEEILSRYMALLDLPSHRDRLLFFIHVEKTLEKEIKEGLARGHCSIPVAKALLELDSDARRRVFALISKLKLNMNQQRILIDFLRDISYAQNMSIAEILEEKAIAAICTDRRKNNPQKTKALLGLLRSRRLPSVVRAEKVFSKQVSRLNLPPGVRLMAPPFFEGPHYRLEVSFRKGKDLMKKINFLSQIKGIRDLCDPWDQDR
jgi:ParB-like chromosome segregation protein Spo0J